MSQLKYLKLFEAFESVKITKTLGYIDNKSKERFINYLKNICNKYDFPISQLNDEMFQYLPYSRALKVNVDSQDTPCKATSKSTFGSSHGIEGEKCEGGRIKRMWGSRQRSVECPMCGGTGLEAPKEELKIIKFWFSKDGDLVNTTGCDGTVKSANKSQNLKVGEEIRAYQGEWYQKLNSIPHLSPVLLKVGTRSPEVEAIFYKERNEFFCIQNQNDGGCPSRSSDWEKYGRYSWNISGGDFNYIKIIKEVTQEEETTEVDPLLYNYLMDWGWRGNYSLEKWRDVESLIKDAHFALILDLSKIKNKEFKTVRKIKSERSELKSGSRLTVTDDQIRKQNIERYLNKIAEKSDIISDISNIKSVTNRIIAGRHALFLIVGYSNFDDKFSRIIDRYFEIMSYKKREVDEDSLNYYLDNLKSNIKSLYQSSGQDTRDINTVLKHCREGLAKDNLTSEYEPLLRELEELSNLIYQKIMSLPFDCIEDLEVVKSKIVSIKRLFQSNTYSLVNLRYFIEGVLSGRKNAYSYLTDDYRLKGNELEKVMDGIQTAKKIISRL